MEQYHRNEPDPWQQFESFTNICTEMLCHPDDIPPPGEGECVGTFDCFDLHARDYGYTRYVFFEGCEDCQSDNDLLPVGEGFRTGGAYRFYSGIGEERICPSGSLPRTGHVRRYTRGPCAFSIDLNDIEYEEDVGLTHIIANQIKDRIWSEYGVYEPTIELAESRVHLGTSSDCGTSVLGNHRDYVHMQLDLFVAMGEHGWGHRCAWMIYFDFWFRPIVTYRDGHWVIDVADYGIRAQCEDWSLPAAALWCNFGLNFYENGCVEPMAELEANAYDQFYSELIGIVDDLFWVEEPFTLCGSDTNCNELGNDAREYNFVGRCNEDGHCEYRPNDIYRVNLYPQELEFILANHEENPEYEGLQTGNPLTIWSLAVNGCIYREDDVFSTPHTDEDWLR